MKLISFAFKNLCSYGNKLQSFTFSEDPQLILVEGKNGGGKSTISDALTFSIYGKSSIRKTKELPNRLNKNGYTYVNFVTNNKENIIIERGLEPNFSKLSINGNDHNLPDKRRVDDFVEEDLVKIPFNVFSNTISLSINEFKSFVKLSPNDKRQIIDKIFGLDIVNDMCKKMKDESKDLKSSLQRLDYAILNNENLLQTTKDQLANMKIDLSAAKSARITELTIAIARLNKDKEDFRLSYTTISAGITNLEKAVNQAREARSAAQVSVIELQKKLKLYDDNQCPYCLSDLTDDNHIALKHTILSTIDSNEKLMPTFATKVTEAQQIFEKKKLELDSAREKFYNVDGQLNPLKREFSELSIADIDDGKGTEYLTGVIENINDSLKKANTEKTQIGNQLKITLEMEEILSDNGMKRILMNQIVPILNKKILRTSKVLEFKFAFEFDVEFNPIITHLGMQISPESLSTGEQKKMNLIVLLCIIELIKLKNNNVNLLFLDEIFSSLDVESIYRVVDLLKTFSKKYRMTIFVISHDPLPEDQPGPCWH
jgi:DNA repair exonuclease SbcCD ATPase subunit